MTLDEFKEKIKELNADQLIERLQNEDSVRTLIQLDIEFGGQARATSAVIDAIPAESLASQADLEDILNGLVSFNSHPKVLESVTTKISKFNREQINAQPWLSTWVISPAFSHVTSKEEATKTLMSRLRKADLENSAYELFGKEVENVNDYNEILQAIDGTDPQDLLAIFENQDKFHHLTRLSAHFQDSGGLVGACISNIPADQWPDGKALIEKFNQALATETPKALEAIVEKVEEFSDQKINLSKDDLRSFVHSHVVTSVHDKASLQDRLSKRIHEASRNTDVADFFDTQKGRGSNVPKANVAMRPASRVPAKEPPSRGIG